MLRRCVYGDAASTVTRFAVMRASPSNSCRAVRGERYSKREKEECLIVGMPVRLASCSESRVCAPLEEIQECTTKMTQNVSINIALADTGLVLLPLDGLGAD